MRREQAEVRPEGVEARRVVGHVLDQLGQPRLVLGVEQQLVRVRVRVRVSTNPNPKPNPKPNPNPNPHRVEVAEQHAAVGRERVDVLDDVQQVRLDVVEPV